MKSHSSFLASIAFACTALIAASPALAHDGMNPGRPNPSPNVSLTQEVGHGTVTVDYGSPGVKGREGKIWGELVPYNEGQPRPWSAGANGNTVITFADDVKVNGHDLKAGAYGLMMIPAEDEWTIVFSSNSKRLGILQYTPDEDVLRLTVKPGEAPYREWLSYDFAKTGDFSTVLSLHWEELSIGFEIVADDHDESSSGSE